MIKLFKTRSTAFVYLIVVATIFCTRLFLWLIWNTQFMEQQQQDSWHHSYSGIVLALISLLLPKKFKVYALAVGIALFIDESYFLHKFIGISACAGYWSLQAYLSLSAWLLILYFVFRFEWWKKFLHYRTKKLGKK